MLSNVNIFGDAGLSASAADTIKPFRPISTSSSVSKNIWFIVSSMSAIVFVSIPMAPIQILSFEPMANNDVCRPAMRGASFKV